MASHIKHTSGSIPAYAGEPNGYAGMNCPAEVYPRVCGGTSTVIFDRLMGMGLSPRMRGNPILRPQAD